MSRITQFKLTDWYAQAIVVLVMESEGGICVRVWNETDVGQLCGDPVRLVLHAEVDQLAQRVELRSAAEPHLFLVCLHIVIHIFVVLFLENLARYP